MLQYNTKNVVFVAFLIRRQMEVNEKNEVPIPNYNVMQEYTMRKNATIYWNDGGTSIP